MKRFLISMLLAMLAGGTLAAQTSRGQCADDRAYLGIYTHSVSEEKAALLHLPNASGSMVTEVLPGGAADRAGLQLFDYIYGVDDYRTDGSSDLSDLLSRYQPGQEATLHLIRNRQPLAVSLILGRPADSIKRKREEGELPFLGVSPRDVRQNQLGVTIDVIGQSTAREMGLQNGDKITAINGRPIIDWADVTTAVNLMEAGDPVTVDFERQSSPMKATAVIKSRRATRQDDDPSAVEYAFLGIYSSSISQEKAHKLGFENAYGSYVTSIISNTAAERAGIQPFDYIYGVDEYRTGEGQSLISILRKYAAGDRATLHLVRKQQNRQVSVTFGSREEARPRSRDKCEEAFLGVQSSHTYVERTGVSVDIIRNSTAQKLGMQDGDLITRINDYPMIDWEDVSTAVDNMTVGTPVEVTWIRGGREMKGREAILSYCQTKTSQITLQGKEPATRPDWAPRTAIRPDLSRVSISVTDLSRDEAADLERRLKLSLKTANEISMRSLQVNTRPEDGKVHLSFELPERGPTSVRIYSGAGRTVYEYDLGTFTGQFGDEIDLLRNGQGSYYLQVLQNGKGAGKKIVVKLP